MGGYTLQEVPQKIKENCCTEPEFCACNKQWWCFHLSEATTIFTLAFIIDLIFICSIPIDDYKTDWYKQSVPASLVSGVVAFAAALMIHCCRNFTNKDGREKANIVASEALSLVLGCAAAIGIDAAISASDNPNILLNSVPSSVGFSLIRSLPKYLFFKAMNEICKCCCGEPDTSNNDVQRIPIIA